MSKKHDNPYTNGSNYNAIFALWRKSQVATRTDLLKIAAKLKMGVKASAGSVTVLLSPRHPDKVRKGADCRGNPSAAGHLYYAEKLSDGKFRLRWRKEELEPRARPVSKKLESTKTQVTVDAEVVETEKEVELG